MVVQAIHLAEDDKFDEAIARLKQAMELSPQFLLAHIEYRRVKEFYLNRRSDFYQEYEEMLRREPGHPVYLMALNYNSAPTVGRTAFESVMEAAPEWAWARYARAILVRDSEPETAAAELRKCVEKDPSAEPAYLALIELYEKSLHRLDEAIRTAESYAAQSHLRPNRLVILWRLRLVQANQSPEAKMALNTELSNLVRDSNDYDTLVAVRSAYKDLLRDNSGIEAAEKKILQIDPAWFPQRGLGFSNLRVNRSGILRGIFFVNRQLALYDMTFEIKNTAAMEDKVEQLESLLKLNPNQELMRIIHEEIFDAAVNTGDVQNVFKYCQLLRQLDPGDYGLLSQTALILADKKAELKQALEIARAAEQATAELQPAEMRGGSSESREREIFRKQRALALDALGWTLYQVGEISESESWLRKSIELDRTGISLKHLAKVLRAKGKMKEAASLATESETMLTDSLKMKIINQDIDDFHLESISGRSYRFTKLKGKVILINFWATWCSPCIQEMALLKRVYEKYKDRGFEIISISLDGYKYKVRPLVEKLSLTFPVFVDKKLKERFDAQTLPTNIFIDRQGKARYRKVGYDEVNEHEFDTVLAELLNSSNSALESQPK